LLARTNQQMPGSEATSDATSDTLVVHADYSPPYRNRRGHCGASYKLNLLCNGSLAEGIRRCRRNNILLCQRPHSCCRYISVIIVVVVVPIFSLLPSLSLLSFFILTVAVTPSITNNNTIVQLLSLRLRSLRDSAVCNLRADPFRKICLIVVIESAGQRQQV
jgi:hypothetical protein